MTHSGTFLSTLWGANRIPDDIHYCGNSSCDGESGYFQGNLCGYNRLAEFRTVILQFCNTLEGACLTVLDTLCLKCTNGEFGGARWRFPILVNARRQGSCTFQAILHYTTAVWQSAASLKIKKTGISADKVHA